MTFVNDNAAVAAAWRGLAQGVQEQAAGGMRVVKNTLNGGELSPALGARFDQARYNTGCEVCENMIPMPQGGVMCRPPLRAMARCAGRNARLVPFFFSANDTRLLEFYEKEGDVGLRVWAGAGQSVETELTLPWAGGVLADVSFCQSADVIFCAHEAFAPCKIERHGEADWRLAQINWLPSISTPVISSISIGGTTEDTKTSAVQTYRITAIDGESGEESLASAEASISAHPLSSTYWINIYPQAQEGVSEFRVYKKRSGVFGFIGRVLVEEDSQLVFEDRNISPDTEDTPPANKNPFEGEDANPSLVFLHQQRLGFASSRKRPLTFWLSQSGNYENMGASIPPNADDAIEATLASQDASRIIWAQSDRTGLAFGTEGGEWLLVSSEGAAITPQDLSFQPQTFYGARAGLPVLRAGGALLFIQKGAGSVREFGYSFQEDRYQSSDLTLLARHLLQGKDVTSWCWQGEPYGIAWLTLSDGSMIGLTYLREHDVIAWHRHFTEGKILQAACVHNLISLNTLFLIVRRVNPETGEDEDWLEYLDDLDGSFADNLDGHYQTHFTGRLIPCFAEAQTESESSFQMIKKISAIKCRVLKAFPFQAKVISQNAGNSLPARVPQKAGSPSPYPQDWYAPVKAGFRDNPRLELSFAKPATLLGISIACEMGDLLGNMGR